MEEQQPSTIRTSPYQSPFQQYGSAIILLTNPENELGKMELTFRGMKLNDDGIPIVVGKRMMNDDGVASVIGSIQSLVNQVSVMSNLDNKNISNLIDYLADTLAKDLMLNRMAYGITSPSTRDKIFQTALSTSFVTLRRAYEEGDKRFWKGSVQEIRTSNDNERKSGFLSSLNPWRK